MSMDIYMYSLSSLVILLSCMILYLYTFMQGLLDKKHLHKNHAGLVKGTSFPFHTLKTIEGEDIKLSNNADGIVVINTSYMCDVCKRIYPFLENIRKEKRNVHFHLVMLANKEQAEDIIETYNLNEFSVSLIQDDDLHNLGITSFPFVYLLSPEGKVIEKGLANYKKDFDLLISFLPYKKVS